jgi:hypothetical protein
MTRLILPTISESDELFTNGFVIVQERRSVTPRRARIWKQQEEKALRAPQQPMRQQSSSHLWCNNNDDNDDSTKRKKRKSRKVVAATNKKDVIILTQNHILETTEHPKCQCDRIPRPPLRTLPSVYFS